VAIFSKGDESARRIESRPTGSLVATAWKVAKLFSWDVLD
jgi:hypothetical protein